MNQTKTSPTNSLPTDKAGNTEEKAVKAIESANQDLAAVRTEIQQRVFGQNLVIDQILITLLSGGHALLVGVPGLAKTLMVETIGTVMGLSNNRIQFTPDLLPADILGSEVLEEMDGKRSFRFIEGPVFTQLLMADEINRASPRTQSALLQAMQEKMVTTAGQTRKLPAPFHVLATQNPIEQEGTYPLPEAQLDRFFMQINVPLPDEETERRVIIETTGTQLRSLKTILSPKKLMTLQKLVREIPVGHGVVDSILTLVRGCRPSDKESNSPVLWGPGPRGAQALMLAIKAKAIMEGRYTPSVEDVLALAKPILRHRMALGFAASANGITVDDFIDERLDNL